MTGPNTTDTTAPPAAESASQDATQRWVGETPPPPAQRGQHAQQACHLPAHPVTVPVERANGDCVLGHVCHADLQPLAAVPHGNLGQLGLAGGGGRGRLRGGCGAALASPGEAERLPGALRGMLTAQPHTQTSSVLSQATHRCHGADRQPAAALLRPGQGAGGDLLQAASGAWLHGQAALLPSRCLGGGRSRQQHCELAGAARKARWPAKKCRGSRCAQSSAGRLPCESAGARSGAANAA